MSKINLSKILEGANLKKSDVASKLFPHVQYPSMAINRVIKGEALLDEEQISMLASLAGCTIDQLYRGGGEWRSKEVSKSSITLIKNEWEAVLDRESWTSRIFKNGTLFHETIMHSHAITLKEYISTIEEIINK